MEIEKVVLDMTREDYAKAYRGWARTSQRLKLAVSYGEDEKELVGSLQKKLSWWLIRLRETKAPLREAIRAYYGGK